MSYNHQEIEKKWQDRWFSSDIFYAKDDSDKEKFYCLIEFPYPSGAGLHAGHPRSYTALDVVARKQRHLGKNVLYPIGWDAFGLPTENYAIKTGRKPREITKENTDKFREQLKSLGISFDWSREIDTTDPEYYKWTQWMFQEFFKAGLTYKSKMAINWCVSCKIGLANEEVVGGACERCGGEVEKRDKEQWMIAITKYADELLTGLDEVNYLEKIKTQQKNWIGKSVGAEVQFEVVDPQGPVTPWIKVFTTRPDTLFGATYMVLAPEHELVEQITTEEQLTEVLEYVKASKAKTDIERGNDEKEKTGVFTGCFAINPVNGKQIPVWVADYVMLGYGTGAIMAVPAHDERDFTFAKKFDLPIIDVNEGGEMSFEGVGILLKTKDGKFLLQQRDENTDRNAGMITPFGGGREEGESLREAAIRELKEELNLDADSSRLRFVGDRISDFVPDVQIRIFEYQLEDKEPKKTNEGRGIARLSKEEILANEKVTEFTKNVVSGNLSSTVWVGDGVVVNSEILNGLKIVEAKEKITSWLEEKKLGKAATNYKLRDWVFSRQRYWGEPIPLVHCDACAAPDQEKVVIFHGWEDSSKHAFIPGLREELEKKNYKTFAFDAPNPMEPKFDEWWAFAEEKLKEIGTENLTVVGHSMGGHLASKLSEKYKFKKLVLVAPAGFKGSEEYFARFKDDLTDEEMNIFRSYMDRDLDVDKVKANVGEMEMIFGEDDKWISKEIQDFYKTSFGDIAKIETWSGVGHMGGQEGVDLAHNISTHFDVKDFSGWIPVPEDQLPVTLPDVDKYEPTETGESPLAAIEEWVNTTCPQCGGPAKRETDTMPNWAGSSWYFLAYAMKLTNDFKFPMSSYAEVLKKWMPVDLYNGGMEHVTLHLLYSRFWNKFLHDRGHVPVSEPYKIRRAHGLVLAEDGAKMSKSKGNGVNPDDVVREYGADALRMYSMFMGPFEEPAPFSINGLIGVRRFLDKVMRYVSNWSENDLPTSQGGNKGGLPELAGIIERHIKKASDDIDAFKFNTAVSTFMQLFNELGDKSCTKDQLKRIITVLCPFAPHIANECWEMIGETGLVEEQSWPEFDDTLLVRDTIEMGVQVNGKVRASIQLAPDADEATAKEIALVEENIQKNIEGKEIVKVIYVPGRILNIVVK